MSPWRLGLLTTVLLACSSLLDLDEDPAGSSSSGGPDASSDDDEASSSSGEEGASSSGHASSSSSGSSGSSTSSSGAASSSGSAGPPLYAPTQLALAALRTQGPQTVQSSRGQCTDHAFVWRDPDGTLHSWSGETGSVTDYTFKLPSGSFFRASDAYLAVGKVPSTGKIGVYRTGQPNALVTELTQPDQWAATSDGVVLQSQVSASAFRVAKWTEVGGVAPLTQTDLSSQQTAIALENDQLVVPSGVTQPYSLYLVDTHDGSVGSVTFDAALVFRSAEPSPRGVFVSYVRAGAVNALRWYGNDLDDLRVELTDAFNVLPSYFADPPPKEHEFISRMAFGGGSTLFYDNFYGIWAYDLDAGSIRPVQLSADKGTFATDVLCVMHGSNKLVYRDAQDPNGRLWTVDLATIP